MIRPILDGVLVLMDPPRTETSGGIIIPENARAEAGSWRAQREPKIGTVLAVGPGRWRRKTSHRENGRIVPDAAAISHFIPMTLKAGDRVLFDPLAELREVDPEQPLLRMGAEYQVAAVLEVE